MKMYFGRENVKSVFDLEFEITQPSASRRKKAEWFWSSGKSAVVRFHTETAAQRKLDGHGLNRHEKLLSDKKGRASRTSAKRSSAHRGVRSEHRGVRSEYRGVRSEHWGVRSPFLSYARRAGPKEAPLSTTLQISLEIALRQYQPVVKSHASIKTCFRLSHGFLTRPEEWALKDYIACFYNAHPLSFSNIGKPPVKLFAPCWAGQRRAGEPATMGFFLPLRRVPGRFRAGSKKDRLTHIEPRHRFHVNLWAR